MSPGCLAASLRLHVASLAVLFHRGCAFFVCVPVFRQPALPATRLFSPLRIPPIWRPPHHPSANFPYLEAANVIHPQQPDHTSHYAFQSGLIPEPLPFPELEPGGSLMFFEPLPFPGLEPNGRYLLSFFSRCEFLLPGGFQRHPSSATRSSHQPSRLRIPPTWRPPVPSIPSSQITPANMPWISALPRARTRRVP